MRRANLDPVDGVLLLDKPIGLSSNTALQRVRVLMHARKAGHTGTLDPLAGGLLPLALGEATKFTQDLLEADKSYTARLALGATTTTGDTEGEVLSRRPVEVCEADFLEVLGRFTGETEQVPPMHSALKHEGQRLFDLARRGIEVERAPRSIRVTRLALAHWDAVGPVIEIDCSKGTYVRTLAQDIGEALGCGAHLAALRRTRVGALEIANAHSLEKIESMDLESRRRLLLAPDALLGGLPRVTLAGNDAARFLHGQGVASTGEQPRVRVYDEAGRLLGLAQAGKGLLSPVRLVAQPGNESRGQPAANDAGAVAPSHFEEVA
jgi:tRNA pseudouridine55 synthase